MNMILGEIMLTIKMAPGRSVLKRRISLRARKLPAAQSGKSGVIWGNNKNNFTFSRGNWFCRARTREMQAHRCLFKIYAWWTVRGEIRDAAYNNVKVKDKSWKLTPSRSPFDLRSKWLKVVVLLASIKYSTNIQSEWKLSFCHSVWYENVSIWRGLFKGYFISSYQSLRSIGLQSDQNIQRKTRHHVFFFLGSSIEK